MVVGELDLHLLTQSAATFTIVAVQFPTGGDVDVYSMQLDVVIFGSDLQQFDGIHGPVTFSIWMFFTGH